MKFKYFVHFMVCSFIHLPDAGVAGRVWGQRDDHSRQCPSRWTRAPQASIGHLKKWTQENFFEGRQNGSFLKEAMNAGVWCHWILIQLDRKGFNPSGWDLFDSLDSKCTIWYCQHCVPMVSSCTKVGSASEHKTIVGVYFSVLLARKFHYGDFFSQKVQLNGTL